MAEDPFPCRKHGDPKLRMDCIEQTIKDLHEETNHAILELTKTLEQALENIIKFNDAVTISSVGRPDQCLRIVLRGGVTEGENAVKTVVCGGNEPSTQQWKLGKP